MQLVGRIRVAPRIPAHAREWADPDVDKTFNDVWKLLMGGLRAAKERGWSD